MRFHAVRRHGPLARQQQQRPAGRPGRAARQPVRLRGQLRDAPRPLALPRALRRPVGRLPDDEAGRARLGAAEDQRRVGRSDPDEGPAHGQLGERAVHRPGLRRRPERPDGTTHPPLQQRLEQLARIQAELSRPND